MIRRFKANRLLLQLAVPSVAARIAGLFLSLTLIILLLGFLLLLLFGSSRSFLVEAETGGVRLVFAGDSNQWRLPNATLCLPVEIPLAPPDDECGSAARSDGIARERLVDWPAGATVDISRTANGSLSIEVVSASGLDVPANAEFKIDAEAWKGAGALTFRAAATVGQDMRTGARHYLHSGRWEAREAGPVTSLLRSVTEVVKEGTFSSGATVTVMIDGNPALVYGHLIPGETETIALTMVSELGRPVLFERHFGVAEAVRIEPDWIDIAISSPILLAAAAIFSIIASGGQVLIVWLRQSGKVLREARSEGLLQEGQSEKENDF